MLFRLFAVCKARFRSDVFAKRREAVTPIASAFWVLHLFRIEKRQTVAVTVFPSKLASVFAGCHNCKSCQSANIVKSFCWDIERICATCCAENKNVKASYYNLRVDSSSIILHYF